ncbi:MAG: DNA-processing protein DprA [Actinomycetota bacterium]
MRLWSPDERVAVATLAGLPGMTLARLRTLLAHAPDEALQMAAGSRSASPAIAQLRRRRPDLAARWTDAARRDPSAMAAALERCSLRVIGPADAEWPDPLRVDPAPPSALFVCGRIDDQRRRVAIVGTRRPTSAGAELAARLGRELTDAGLSIVSGLALGVDGAAHRGALSANEPFPIGVVANGHDVPYPRRHAPLWGAVAAAGAVISEWPPGVPPDAFRFPLRNRIIAALSEIVIVVESRERGGSLLTARDAAERGVEVMAVPGRPGAPASAGTNQLVRDGAALVAEPSDVLDALSIDHSRSTMLVDRRPPPSGPSVAVLAAIDDPVTIETLVRRTGLELGQVAVSLARLERDGWVFETDGWFESLDRWSTLLSGETPS